jgi:hypothetical protein
MTFDEIVSEVMDRLNLTSEDSRERIEKRVNSRYRRVTSSIGLQTSRRMLLDVSCDGVNDTELPEVEIPDLEKITRIKMTGDDGGVRLLKEKTYDEINNVATLDGTPQSWAVKLMDAASTTILLDGFPSTETFTLTCEGYDRVIDMQGDQEPFFPEDFHDILVEGVMSDELRKMEKAPLAAIAEQNYALRLSDLRFFIAKSGYLDVVQGKNRPGQTWYRPWYSRNGIYN